MAKQAGCAKLFDREGQERFRFDGPLFSNVLALIDVDRQVGYHVETGHEEA